jgi:diguanylate cyclase (GGDEF)-like protein
MDEPKESRTYKTFIIAVSIVIILFVAGIFLGISFNTKRLVDHEVLSAARAHFDGIVMTRKWNAKHGGVFVEMKPGMEPNPYLDDSAITSKDGKVYIKKNPAMMTREISEYSEKEGLFSFHITSLYLINPDNKPDEFEESALRAFENGQKEFFREAKKKNRTYFRYMAPLYIEEECLECHAQHGYELGDVRGGISVTFDTEDIKKELRSNFFIISLLGITSVTILLANVYFFTLRLTKKITSARQKIEELATHDELTGLYNRRHVLTRFNEEFIRAKRLRKDLGCIMVDIDHFKGINDRHGHLIGDQVLREVAHVIKLSTRAYDVVGRYGGEEFLILLPDTHLDDSQNLAERMRNNIKKDLLIESDITYNISVTISAGVTYLYDDDSSIDDVIKRADDSLYKAKNAGRDRVESL